MVIPIDKIIIQDRIRKAFGDIEELASDIRQNGLINPPVISKSYELIAGERRIRALKMLGKTEIEVRMMDVEDAETMLNMEISENEVRKDFSKSERIDYARRLERIESIKAERRRRATQNNDTAKAERQNSDEQAESGRTDDIVAEKLNIGSRDTYRKEKAIADNRQYLPPDDFADWDEGRLSTNKAYQRMKAELEAARQEEESAVAEARKSCESMRRQVERAEADCQKMREKYQQASKKAEQLEAAASRDAAMADADRDMQFFTAATHDYIRRYGGHVWSFEQIEKISEPVRKDFIKAITTLDGFCQQLLRNIGGTLNGK